MESIDISSPDFSIDRLKDQVKTCLVIGGFGFLGHRLAQILYEQSCDVRLLSPFFPEKITHPEIKSFLGDILFIEDLQKACKGVDTVFHVAAVILPYRIMRRKMRENVYNVNVKGTQNVIKACKECGVSRLIYTSSNNVVFDHEIQNGDENLPYATKKIDIYTATKIKAEQEIIEANGQSGLSTCIIRPGGIYGPGDKLILYRLIQTLKTGCLLFTIGNGKSLADSVYVDNLVYAHLLAAVKLKTGSPVAGQAYFISDGEPSNYFEFLRPIIQKMGFKYPRCAIPYVMGYVYAFLGEWIYWLFNSFKPSLTIMEVKKICLSNYFSIEKAKRELGYRPLISQQDGIDKSIPYCKELYSQIQAVDRPKIFWWLSVIVGMTILGIIAFQANAGAYWNQFVPIVPLFYLKILFWLALLTHIIEAMYALKCAIKNGLNDTAYAWCFQTFLLGYPSLRLLLKRSKKSGTAYE